MVGIYVNGMEMPIQCVSCPFWKVTYIIKPMDICGAVPKKIEQPYGSRPEWCPLSEYPAADAPSAHHAEWTQENYFDEDANVYVCSNCGEPWTLIEGTPQENNMNFCPKCGAKMDGEQE